jgi:hypothetical protein
MKSGRLRSRSALGVREGWGGGSYFHGPAGEDVDEKGGSHGREHVDQKKHDK